MANVSTSRRRRPAGDDADSAGESPSDESGQPRRQPHLNRPSALHAWLPVSLQALILTLVVAAIVGAVAAEAVLAATPVTYQSTATLFINDPQAVAASGDAGELAKLSALRAEYAELLSTQLVTAQLAGAAGLSPAAASGTVSASLPADSLLMDVTATASTAGMARRLAAAAAGVVVRDATASQAAAGIPPAQRYTFTQVTPAQPAVRMSAKLSRQLLVGALAGVLTFGLALGVATARERRRIA